MLTYIVSVLFVPSFLHTHLCIFILFRSECRRCDYYYSYCRLWLSLLLFILLKSHCKRGKRILYVFVRSYVLMGTRKQNISSSTLYWTFGILLLIENTNTHTHSVCGMWWNACGDHLVVDKCDIASWITNYYYDTNWIHEIGRER